MKEITIDATAAVLGRLAAFCAKMALRGNKLEVVNIEKAVISGKRATIVAVYKKRRGMTQPANPEHAAKWPRRPDLLFKRILSGMLPSGRRGKEALGRVKVYLGNPGKTTTASPVKSASKLRRSHISLEKLCSELGWNIGK